MSDADARLARYRAKRDFAKTPEPAGVVTGQRASLAFVIQKHAASSLHYDFRLEFDGAMLSWAIPKGPSYDPTVKRMAVQVEDHPLSYNSFEGTIPKGQYGAGTVIIWDHGVWEPVLDVRKGLVEGKLAFRLYGQKMAGLWELVRIRKPGQQRQDPWLLFKKRDAYARPQSDYDVVTALPDSVVAKPLPPASREAPGAAALPASPGSTGSSKPGAVAPASPASGAGKAVALVGAVKAELPAKLSPQLATLCTSAPGDGDWVYEIKFDGYRIMTRIDRGKPTLITRGGHDWSSRMPGLVTALRSLGVRSGWLDGEIVVMGDDGLPSFNALQNAFDQASTHDIVYFVFDVPFLGGYDLRQVPLVQRRQRLQGLLESASTEHVRFSGAFESDAASIMQSACKMNLEGVIAKRADAPYVSRRSETWLKLKCRHRQEFVIAGFTDRQARRGAAEIGSLLLGVHDDAGRLVSVGSVGTGWSSAAAADLKRQLVEVEVEACPFATATKTGRWSKRPAGSERWVKPRLVAEVSFGEWTPDGQIRHATFHGLRTDKPAKAITREHAKGPAGALPVKQTASTTKITHPERVVDPSTGMTKLDLVRYYESVADWMLPHLKGRPCSLVRGPAGIDGQLFFQKHAEKLRIPDLRELDPGLMPGHEALLEVPTAKALAGAAQMNVIEFHTWNALARSFDKPNRMVFDLDPGNGVGWDRVQEAAVLVHALLAELGLKAWLKTSGGKGLHVVVPLAPRHGWDTVKGFSKAVVQHLARVIPDRFVARSGPSNRVGKIFVDYLRNSHGATTAAAFSARARPGLGVSMPVAWEHLSTLKGGAHWTIATAREHLSFQKEDPWTGYWTSRQSITAAMKALGYKPTGDD